MLVNGDVSLLASRDVTLPWMFSSQCSGFFNKELRTTQHGLEF